MPQKVPLVTRNSLYWRCRMTTRGQVTAMEANDARDMKALTAAEMREVDRLTTERYGIPSLTLMENAGTSVAEFMRPEVSRTWSSGAVVLLRQREQRRRWIRGGAEVARDGRQRRSVYLFADAGRNARRCGGESRSLEKFRRAKCMSWPAASEWLRRKRRSGRRTLLSMPCWEPGRAGRSKACCAKRSRL